MNIFGLSNEDINLIKTEFVWFFNGNNNAQFLFKNGHYLFLDELYNKYIIEIQQLVDSYELNDNYEIIKDETYLHQWFADWKTLTRLSKEQFKKRISENEEFSNVWGDMGITDSLELRNWGIQIGFDHNQEAYLKAQGYDQILNLVTSIINNPLNGIHFLTFYNPLSLKYRIQKNNLLSIQFICRKVKNKYKLNIIVNKCSDENLNLEKEYVFFNILNHAIAKICNVIPDQTTIYCNNRKMSTPDSKIKINILKTTFDTSLKLNLEDVSI